jgi:hypothetical protein
MSLPPLTLLRGCLQVPLRQDCVKTVAQRKTAESMFRAREMTLFGPLKRTSRG